MKCEDGGNPVNRELQAVRHALYQKASRLGTREERIKFFGGLGWDVEAEIEQIRSNLPPGLPREMDWAALEGEAEAEPQASRAVA